MQKQIQMQIADKEAETPIVHQASWKRLPYTGGICDRSTS